MNEIKGQVLGAEAVGRWFAEAPKGIRERVRNEVNSLGTLLQAKVIGKLSDDYLHVRTGRLRRSINQRFREDGSTIQTSVGTNVSYGRRYEIGGSWVEQVRSHFRRSKGGKGGGMVRAFTRNINVRPRPFLRDSLAEMKDDIRARLVLALRGGA